MSIVVFIFGSIAVNMALENPFLRQRACWGSNQRLCSLGCVIRDVNSDHHDLVAPDTVRTLPY
jgi:hypothetical protein